MIILVILTLAAAVYAHYRLGRQVAAPGQRWLARLLLIAVGAGFGWAMSAVYLSPIAASPFLAFLAGFGIVHVPAAFILWLKKAGRRQRGAPPPR